MFLTRDAKVILYSLYKEYLRRRRQGLSRSESRTFDSSKSIHESFCKDILIEDLEDGLRELDRNKFVKNLYADDTVSQCSLTDFAISEMENRSKDTFLSIADFISKFIP